MGNKSRRRERFFRNHPNCCFCGGETPAEEIDHIPSRQFFSGKRWPEGFEFPACATCNRRTARDEQVVAFLARFSLDEPDPEDQKEFQKISRAIQNNHGAIADYVTSATARDTRNALRAIGIKNIGPSQISVAKIDHPDIIRAMDSFYKKLSLALFYKHTGNSLRSEGALFFRVWTNYSVMGDEFSFDELVNYLGAAQLTQRQTTPLQDQFSYRYGVSEDKNDAGFLCRLRYAFGVAIAISQNGDRLANQAGFVHRCFDPPPAE